MADKSKPDVKPIRNLTALPELSAGQKYSFKPAATIDQARGVCMRYRADKGWWLKNRVYFLTNQEVTACNG